MVIKYIAYTWQGERVEGILDVEREEEARELLHRDDLIPYRLSRVRQRPSLASLAPFLFKPKAQELIEFTRGIAALLRSGIPLRETLVILRTESSSLGLKEVIRQVIEDIEGGTVFWSDRPVCMLGSRNGGFPPGWATGHHCGTDYNLPVDPPRLWRPFDG